MKKIQKKHKSTNLDTCETWSPGSLQSAKAAEGRKAKVQKKQITKRQRCKNIKVQIWTHVRLGSRREVCSLGGQFRSQKANRLRESGWNIPFLVWEEKTANKKESTQLM